jgi:hypothetical protein
VGGARQRCEWPVPSSVLGLCACSTATERPDRTGQPTRHGANLRHCSSSSPARPPPSPSRRNCSTATGPSLPNLPYLPHRSNGSAVSLHRKMRHPLLPRRGPISAAHWPRHNLVCLSAYRTPTYLTLPYVLCRYVHT